MSKLSEKHLREEKVERLKTKILGEIEHIKSMCLRDMEMFLHSNDSDDIAIVEHSVGAYFRLMQLKRFVELPDVFMGWYKIIHDRDLIIYTVKDEDLDIWLQDSYSFTHNYLFLTEDEPLSVVDVLDEKFLGLNFTNYFDKVEYKRKMEEKKDENNN